MKQRYGKFNPKRRLAPPPGSKTEREQLETLAKQAQYGGNPEHKRNPGDFGLEPPADPRRGKSLCDDVKIFTRAEARALLQEGLRRGMVSDRQNGGWPKNVWSMTLDGMPLESQLENPVLGTYHGYPMPESDPFAEEVRNAWKERHVEN